MAKLDGRAGRAGAPEAAVVAVVAAAVVGVVAAGVAIVCERAGARVEGGRMAAERQKKG